MGAEIIGHVTYPTTEGNSQKEAMGKKTRRRTVPYSFVGGRWLEVVVIYSLNCFIFVIFFSLDMYLFLPSCLQGEEAMGVKETLVLQGHFTMLFLGGLLCAITTCPRTLIHFFWSSLISRSGQMFISKIMPKLLFLCSGVVCRSLNCQYFLPSLSELNVFCCRV